MTELRPMTGLARYKMAAELEAEGVSAADIAERCGYSGAAAWYAAKAYYKKAEERFNVRAAQPEEADVPMPSTASHVAGRRIPIPQRVKTPEILPAQIYALKPRQDRAEAAEPVGAAADALDAAMDRPKGKLDALIHSLKPAPAPRIDPAPVMALPVKPARGFRVTAMDGALMRYNVGHNDERGDYLIVTSQDNPQCYLEFPMESASDCLAEIADALQMLKGGAS